MIGEVRFVLAIDEDVEFVAAVLVVFLVFFNERQGFPSFQEVPEIVPIRLFVIGAEALAKLFLNSK